MSADPAKLPDDWWRHGDLRVEFQQTNTKQPKSKAFERYELYKHSATVAEAMKNGASREDLQNDLRRSLLTVTSTEADADKLRTLRSVKRNLTSPEKAANTPQRKKTENHDIGTPSNMSEERFGDTAATPSAPSDGPATLAAIESLLEVKLNPVAASIHGLQTEFAGLRVSVEERLRAMELRISTADVRIEKLEMLIEEKQVPPACDGKLAEQIKNMEADIAALRQGTSHAHAPDRECTAVLGGLSALDDEDEATTWLKDKLASLTGPKPHDIYTKGDEFRGIIFARFANKRDRDDAVSKLRRARCQQEGKEVWAKPDLPFEERTMRHLVFGAKRVMTEWGYDKAAIWADPDKGMLSVGGEKVMSAKLEGKTLKMEYGPGWEEFLHDDAKHPEWKNLLQTIRDKLANAPGKGKGKAKSHAQ